MVPGAEGEGCWHQIPGPTPLFRHPCAWRRGDGQAQLALLAPWVSIHHPASGHPSAGVAGHWEERSLGGGRLPMSRRGWYPLMPKISVGTTPALTTGSGHAQPLYQQEVPCGYPQGWHQGWALVLCYGCCVGQRGVSNP